MDLKRLRGLLKRFKAGNIAKLFSQEIIDKRQFTEIEKFNYWKEMDYHYAFFQDLLPFNEESREILNKLNHAKMNNNPEVTMEAFCKIVKLFKSFRFVMEAVDTIEDIQQTT